MEKRSKVLKDKEKRQGDRTRLRASEGGCGWAGAGGHWRYI
jgi:hypothetical protein